MLQTLTADWATRSWVTTDPPAPITAIAFLVDASAVVHTTADLPAGITSVFVDGAFSFGVNLSSTDNIVADELATTPDATPTSVTPDTWPASGTIAWQRSGRYSKTTTCSGTRSGSFSGGGSVMDGNCRGTLTARLSCDNAVAVFLGGAEVTVAGTFTNTNPVLGLAGATVVAYDGATEVGRQALGDVGAGAAVNFTITFPAAPVSGSVRLSVQAARGPGASGVLLPASSSPTCTFEPAGTPLAYTSAPPPTPATVTAVPFVSVGEDRASPSPTTTVYVDASVTAFTAGFSLTTTSVEPVSVTAPGYITTDSPLPAITATSAALEISQTAAFEADTSSYS